MDTIFERFSKYVKDEFGLTVIKKTNQATTSFKSLFGMSAEETSRYELPYIIIEEEDEDAEEVH